MPSVNQGLERVIELKLLPEIVLEIRRYMNDSPGDIQH